MPIGLIIGVIIFTLLIGYREIKKYRQRKQNKKKLYEILYSNIVVRMANLSYHLNNLQDDTYKPLIERLNAFLRLSVINTDKEFLQQYEERIERLEAYVSPTICDLVDVLQHKEGESLKSHITPHYDTLYTALGEILDSYNKDIESEILKPFPKLIPSHKKYLSVPKEIIDDLMLYTAMPLVTWLIVGEVMNLHMYLYLTGIFFLTCISIVFAIQQIKLHREYRSILNYVKSINEEYKYSIYGSMQKLNNRLLRISPLESKQLQDLNIELTGWLVYLDSLEDAKPTTIKILDEKQEELHQKIRKISYALYHNLPFENPLLNTLADEVTEGLKRQFLVKDTQLNVK